MQQEGQISTTFGSLCLLRKGHGKIPTIFALATISCEPIPSAETNQNYVPGVFIPTDTIKKLEGRGNDQSLGYPQLEKNSVPVAQDAHGSTEQNPNSNTNSLPANYSPNQQPIYTNLQQGTQQPVLSNQPILLNQQQPNQAQILIPQSNLQNQQPILLRPGNQPNQAILIQQPNNDAILVTQPVNQVQPNQAILVQNPNGLQPQQNQAILVQQPGNQQAILVPQQPNQPLSIQNGQLMGQTIIANPGNERPSGNQVYTIVPLNGQNLGNNYLGNNGNTYLVPVQQLPNNNVLLNKVN
ncbi:transcription factor SPT20 homolog [Achroia grisella]|uniref:transcription factor SPT20 homolog n=1 Tax=Achroia grisella TaxID=688607 RepID=UPI0027D22300|nr:transcription factor SPT20 homolog [Achroia grisella]